MSSKTAPPEFITLYHGTCEGDAAALMARGWRPSERPSGANRGRTDMLYCSTGAADALWFAEQKGCDVVLQLSQVPIAFLGIDPEDGMESTVAAELATARRLGLPAKLTVRVPLDASYFSRVADPWSAEPCRIDNPSGARQAGVSWWQLHRIDIDAFRGYRDLQLQRH